MKIEKNFNPNFNPKKGDKIESWKMKSMKTRKHSLDCVQCLVIMYSLLNAILSTTFADSCIHSCCGVNREIL